MMTQALKDFLQFLNGFRKLSFMVVLLTTGIVFRSLGLINGSEFVDLLKASTVAFMATNGIEHLSKSVIEWVKGKAAE